MRVISAVAAAVVLSLATPALAQEDWDNFKFPEDGFEVNFPGKPMVENTTWVSQYRYNLPAKVYSATHGRERYSVTIVDYRVLPKMGEARSKQCPAGAETCIGTQDDLRGPEVRPAPGREDHRHEPAVRAGRRGPLHAADQR